MSHQFMPTGGGDTLQVHGKAVLLEAEPHHYEQCGRLHFDLARYHCLLGELDYARQRLRKACKMDANWNEAVLDDRDLKAIWGDLNNVG